MGSHVLSMTDLPTAVIKATTPITGSTEDRVEGDAVGMMELTEYVRLHQNCLPDLCKLLKARLKDVDEMVSRISLDVIDQCQQAFGYVFQNLVLKNMLKRILIMSEPKSGLSYKLREASCKYLLLWGERYGIDPRLKKFREASAEIRKRAAKDEAKEMKAMAEAARVAKQADMEELKSQLMQRGHTPNAVPRAGSVGGQGSSRSLTGSQGGSASNLFSASFGKGSGRNLLNAARGPQMAQVATATFNGLKPMVEEHLGMLSALMDGMPGQELASNHQAEKSARSCTILRNKLEAISEHLSSTNNHAALVECLGITEELSRRLQGYEKIRVQFGAHHGGFPMSRTPSGRSSSGYSGADTDRSGVVQGMIYDGASSAAGGEPSPSAPLMPMGTTPTSAGSPFVPKANQIEMKEQRNTAKDNQIVPKFNSAPVFWSPATGNLPGQSLPNTPYTASSGGVSAGAHPFSGGSSHRIPQRNLDRMNQAQNQAQNPSPLGNGIVPQSLNQTPAWAEGGVSNSDEYGEEEEEEEEEEGGGFDKDFLSAQLDPELRKQMGLDVGGGGGGDLAAMLAGSMGISPQGFRASGLPTAASPESLSPREHVAAAAMGARARVPESSLNASSIAAAAAGVQPQTSYRDRSNSVNEGSRLVLPSQMRKKNSSYDWGECVLTCDTIRVPVRASDGHIYEKWAIEKWLKENNCRSPLTNVQISPALTLLTDKDIPGGAAMMGMLSERSSEDMSYAGSGEGSGESSRRESVSQASGAGIRLF